VSGCHCFILVLCFEDIFGLYLPQHVNGEEHKAFIRDKSNYEGLDKAIGLIPSTITFLQSVLLQHCLRKQCDNSSDKGYVTIFFPFSYVYVGGTVTS